MNERFEDNNTVVLQPSTKADRPRASADNAAKRLIRRQLQTGALLEMETALQARSHLASDKSIVLDSAYEEYCVRAEQGAAPDVYEFARRFPEYETSIIRLLEIHRLLSYDESGPIESIDWPEIGEGLLGFQLIEELGRGGFARVYLAQEQELDHRRVVVKVSARGIDEAQILARLNHPHIVPIHSIRSDQARGITLICMPFLGRRTGWDVLHRVRTRGLPSSAVELEDLLQVDEAERNDAPLPRSSPRLPRSYTEFVVRTGAALAEALACAHERGVCHGDLKPSNILLTPAGEPMLLDFNLAVQRDSSVGGGGTLPYMAPEQLTAIVRSSEQNSVTPQTDIHALGIVLYELLTGQEPFGPMPPSQSRAELCGELLDRRRQGPRPIRQFNADVDAELERIVLSCLAYSAADRPTTAQELSHSLRGNLRYTKRAQRWVSRHRRVAMVACALAIVATFVLSFAAYRREPFPLRMLHQAEQELLAGETNAALASVQGPIDAEPQMPEPWILRARIRQQVGDFTAAIEDYATAYHLTGNPALLAAQGYCWQQMAHHKEAIAFFNEAIQHGVNAAEVWNDLGYSYLQIANYEQAKPCLTQAVALNEKLQAAHHNRAQLQINLALNSGTAPSAEACSDIDTAIALGPPSADLYQLAAVLHRLRELNGVESSGKAKDCLTKALECGLPLETCQSNPLFADLLPSSSGSTALKAKAKSLPAVRIIDPLIAVTPANVAVASPNR